MTDTTRTNPNVTTAPRSTDNTRTERNETPTTPEMNFVHDPHAQAARTDPQAGQFPAGPGNAGPKDYPEENAGSPGTKWSTKNIVIGLGVAVLVIVVLMMVF